VEQQTTQNRAADEINLPVDADILSMFESPASSSTPSPLNDSQAVKAELNAPSFDA
jgi:hypothetical protein